MPPSKIRVIPRRGSPKPESEAPGPAATGAPDVHEQQVPARPLSVVERLREREGRLLTARKLAEILGYDNVKRIYELPIERWSVGAKGDRALRWDPASVISWLEGRHEPPPHRTAAFLDLVATRRQLSNADLAQVLALPRSVIPYLQLPTRDIADRGRRYWSGRVIARWLLDFLEHSEQRGAHHGR